MKILEVILGLVAAVLVLAVGYLLYMEFIGNPRVAREIAENPDGDRARKAMLPALPSGRSFAKLRPNAIEGVGTLFEIRLGGQAQSGEEPE